MTEYHMKMITSNTWAMRSRERSVWIDEMHDNVRGNVPKELDCGDGGTSTFAPP